MNDSKVYHLSKDVEDQCLTEDSKIRLYLSPMRYEKPKKKEKDVFKNIIATAVALSYSTFFTYVIGQWGIESAAKCRGYDAIGGEYILIFAVFITSFWLLWKILSGGYRG